jgi:hypothetical protein
MPDRRSLCTDPATVPPARKHHAGVYRVGKLFRHRHRRFTGGEIERAVEHLPNYRPWFADVP